MLQVLIKVTHYLLHMPNKAQGLGRNADWGMYRIKF